MNNKLILLLCSLFSFISFNPGFSQTNTSDSIANYYAIKAQSFTDDLKADSALLYYQKAANIYQKRQQLEVYYLIQCKAAQQLIELKKYAQARRLLTQHLVSIKSLTLPHLEGLLYHYLGEVAYAQEKFGESLKWAKRAEGYVKQINLQQIDNQRLIAASKARLAYFAESIQLTRQCLAQLDKLPESQEATEVRVKILLLQSRIHIGRRAFEKGLDASYTAEKLLKKLSARKRTLLYLSSVFTRQALIYKLQQRFKLSRIKYHQNITLSKQLYSTNHPQVGYAYWLLGRALSRQAVLNKKKDLFDSALYYLHKSDTLYQAQQPLNKAELGQVYTDIARTYDWMENYKKASVFFERAYDLFKEVYGETNPNLAYFYLSWVVHYNRMGRYDKQLPIAQKLLISNSRFHRDSDVRANPELNDYYNVMYYFMGVINKASAFVNLAKDTEDLKQALRHFLIADGFLKAYSQSLFRKKDQLLVAHNINALNSANLGRNTIYTCDALYQRTQQEAYLDTAFYFMERGNVSYLLSSLVESNAKKISGIPEELLKKETHLRKKIAQYQHQRSSQKPDSLIKYNQLYEDFIHKLEKKYPKYAHLKFDTKRASIAQIKAKLKPEEALLAYSFARYGNNYALLITKNQVKLIQLPFSERINKYTNPYYEQLQSEAGLKSFATASHSLYKALFQPLEKHLKGIKKIVVVAPSLESVPFESLVTKLPAKVVGGDFTKLDYLVNRFQISYHYSATLWHQAQLDKTTTNPKSLDLVAFAPFSGGKGNVFSTKRGSGLNLPESKVEVSSIFNLCKTRQLNARVSLSHSATKEQFIQQARQANIIHIASHSEANYKNAGLAKIRFAGCGATKGDVSGCLLASEVYNLELNADLLVLSSCESGVGKLIKGEGVLSLARSFLYAGARNIVFSLWEIDDQYTRKLMVAFYQQFLGKEAIGYQKALQIAQQTLMKQGVHPKHWAGIVMIGK